MHSEYTVPWVAAGSPSGPELAQKWIDSKEENIAAAGWATLSSWVAITEDAGLDQKLLKQLLERVQKSIHQAPNRVRMMMNGFVIAVGTYVEPLHELAKKTAAQIDRVSVYVGDTACKVPFAPEYIDKAKLQGKVGRKRKRPKC